MRCGERVLLNLEQRHPVVTNEACTYQDLPTVIARIVYNVSLRMYCMEKGCLTTIPACWRLKPRFLFRQSWSFVLPCVKHSGTLSSVSRCDNYNTKILSSPYMRHPERRDVGHDADITGESSRALHSYGSLHDR
jgi:hypothetical protein